MKCQSCSRKVHKKDRYCPYCGEMISPRGQGSSAGRQRSGSETNWFIIIGAVAAGILLGVIAMYSWFPRTSTGSPGGFDPTLRGQALLAQYPQVYEVASHFTCPCGSCTDGLEICDCTMKDGAAEVRSFIYAQLQSGHLPPHIIEMVAQRWGHRKSQPLQKFNPAIPGDKLLIPQK